MDCTKFGLPYIIWLLSNFFPSIDFFSLPAVTPAQISRSTRVGRTIFLQVRPLAKSCIAICSLNSHLPLFSDTHLLSVSLFVSTFALHIKLEFSSSSMANNLLIFYQMSQSLETLFQAWLAQRAQEGTLDLAALGQPASSSASLVSGAIGQPESSSSSISRVLPTLSAPLPATSAPPFTPSPPISSYMSLRLPASTTTRPPISRGHPNPANPSNSLFQPILGTTSLAVGMTLNSNQPRRSLPSASLTNTEISGANTTRLAAAHAHLPSAPPLVARRAIRTRGRAAGHPILPAQPTNLRSAIETDPATGVKFVRTEIHVHLAAPRGQAQKSIPLMFRLYPKFTTYLDSQHLLFRYRLHESTSLADIAQQTANDMAASPLQWQFPQPSSSLADVLGPSFISPLRLLGLTNRGIPRSNGLIMLRPQNDDLSLTLGALIGNPSKYIQLTKAGVCVRESRLILNFHQFSSYINEIIQLTMSIDAQTGTSCLTNVGDAPARRHSSCISDYFRSVFSAENELGEHNQNWKTPVCESDDEEDFEDEDTDDSYFENLPPSPTPTSQPMTRSVARQASQSVLSSALFTTPQISALPSPLAGTGVRADDHHYELWRSQRGSCSFKNPYGLKPAGTCDVTAQLSHRNLWLYSAIITASVKNPWTLVFVDILVVPRKCSFLFQENVRCSKKMFGNCSKKMFGQKCFYTGRQSVEKMSVPGMLLDQNLLSRNGYNLSIAEGEHMLTAVCREESWDEGAGLSGKFEESRGGFGKSSGGGEGKISDGAGTSRKDRLISASSRLLSKMK
ncbi:hypothetical protein GGX14DRAFT_387199 [Mycena pura]|uniref:Uncharacterized protein n=1 Tax=Mycena pura TaxID=153505 RepID=A0AAD6YNJ1_9AGAR|nr:hypothetical protein GGX14DRAFT_387199 [Mycena pura]